MVFGVFVYVREPTRITHFPKLFPSSIPTRAAGAFCENEAVVGCVNLFHGDFCEDQRQINASMLGDRTTDLALMAAEHLGLSNALTEFQPAAYKIRVNVGLEDVCDGNLLLPNQGDVFFHVGSGIKNRRNACAVIAEQIRKLRDTFSLNPFKDKGHAVLGGGNLINPR